MKRRVVLVLMMLSVSLSACVSEEVTPSTEVSVNAVTMVEKPVETEERDKDKWVENSSTLSTETNAVEVIEPTESVEESITPSTEVIESESTEPTESVEPTESEEIVKGAEERENLVNTYADIDLSVIETDISLEDYPWFVLPDDVSEYDYHTYQVIVGTLSEYFNGDVQDTYTCNIKEDIVSMETNVVFKIRVHGEKSDILFGWNGYENTASVEVVE